MSGKPEDYIFSDTTHWIANSGRDEHGAYRGGRAGDQTGREAELKKWYNRPWTAVLRYPNQTVALEIAKLSVAMCLNDSVGYDQGERGTYWKALKAAGYDPSKAALSEQDCTAGVSANVRAAGCLCGVRTLQELPLCTSRNMRAEFVKAGFEALTASRYRTGGRYLLPGDILLYENHHAACNITCGTGVRDLWNPLPEPAAGSVETVDDVAPPRVLATGNVFVRAAPDHSADRLGVCSAGGCLHGYGFSLNGFHLVAFDGRTGWVSEKYAIIESENGGVKHVG